MLSIDQLGDGGVISANIALDEFGDCQFQLPFRNHEQPSPDLLLAHAMELHRRRDAQVHVLVGAFEIDQQDPQASCRLDTEQRLAACHRQRLHDCLAALAGAAETGRERDRGAQQMMAVEEVQPLKRALVGEVIGREVGERIRLFLLLWFFVVLRQTLTQPVHGLAPLRIVRPRELLGRHVEHVLQYQIDGRALAHRTGRADLRHPALRLASS